METTRENPTVESEAGSSFTQLEAEFAAIFPGPELENWYDTLPLESKLAAAMLMSLSVVGSGGWSPDGGLSGLRILKHLNKDIFAADDLPGQLEKFRTIYFICKQGC